MYFSSACLLTTVRERGRLTVPLPTSLARNLSWTITFIWTLPLLLSWQLRSKQLPISPVMDVIVCNRLVVSVVLERLTFLSVINAHLNLVLFRFLVTISILNSFSFVTLATSTLIFKNIWNIEIRDISVWFINYIPLLYFHNSATDCVTWRQCFIRTTGVGVCEYKPLHSISK